MVCEATGHAPECVEIGIIASNGEFDTNKVLSSEGVANQHHTESKSQILVNKANDLLHSAHDNIHASSLDINPSELVYTKEIGEGQFGLVFKGAYRGRKCAIKKLKSGVSKENLEYQSIAIEMSVLLRIGRHPNVVEFFGACVDDSENPIIVEEYVGDTNLQDFLFSKYPGFNLGFSKVQKWALDILSALEHLHGLNPVVVHRDVKPANLLICADRNSLKLTDFGLSKLAMPIPATAGEGRRTSLCRCHSAKIGTPRYGAPEVFHPRPADQCGNDLGYDEKVDVYSAAIIIWYLITGFKPDCSAQLDPTARPDVEPAKKRSATLTALLEEMWDGDPDARPSAAECVARVRSMVPPPSLARSAMRSLGRLCGAPAIHSR